MIEALLEFILSAAVIIGAGVFLTKCADQIAKSTGLGGLLVGSIFLAAATSLPEFMVNISAVRLNAPNLAFGNLFGSSLFNLLILAICDLLYKSKGKLFSPASVTHALSATQSTAMTALAGLGILLAPKIAPYAIGPVGLTSILILVAYILGLRMVFLNDQLISNTTKKGTKGSLKNLMFSKALFGYICSAAVIMIAAPFVARSAGTIAELSGLGDSFVGTTLVALCTSLPELVASLAAVRMGSYDLALGNIFGSNAFNMLLIAPLDFMSNEPLLASASPIHLITCLSTIIVTVVALMGQLYQVEKRKSLVEPDATMIIVLVISALAGVYYLR